LKENGWSKVFFAVPPIGRTRCRAAGTENAFVEAVELFAVFFGLAEFSALCEERLVGFGGKERVKATYVWRGGVALQVGFDGFVLFVELS